MKFILQPLLEKEWLIVSGFARGIDTIAHEVTVRQHCPTIAILGHGLSYMYQRRIEVYMTRGKIIYCY